MATVNSSNLFRPTAAPAAAPAAEDRPKSMLWANIGYYTPMVNAEGVTENVFISVPVGIPLDTMKPVSVPRPEGFFKDLRSAQNQLLTGLQEMISQIPAGDNAVIPELQVQIVHVNDAPIVESNNIVAPKFSLTKG